VVGYEALLSSLHVKFLIFCKFKLRLNLICRIPFRGNLNNICCKITCITRGVPKVMGLVLLKNDRKSEKYETLAKVAPNLVFTGQQTYF
jgi:hypothetical protein